MSLFFVMIGGFLGSICRFAVGELIHTQNGFPMATFLINLIGCFILSWFLTFARRWKKFKPEFTLVFGTGFIGSFTTFSTFSVETMQLFQTGHFFVALIYILSTTILGLLFAYLGCKLALIK